jgi:hypothetical protein
MFSPILACSEQKAKYYGKSVAESFSLLNDLGEPF